MSRLIDADVLKDKAIHEANRLGSYGYMDAKSIIDLIDDAPTIEPQQWIPVTERLPKKYIGEWLCCDKYGNIFILRYENTTPNGDCVFCYTDNDGYSVSVHDVVAWMPLPKTFREGGEA